MDQWEYLPTYIEADVDNKELRETLKAKYDVKRPPKYMAEAMAPAMNALGDEGWELVHMEPVARKRKKGDVLMGAAYRWTNVYFCVFKRLKTRTPQVVMPVRSDGQPAFPTAADQRDGTPLQSGMRAVAPQAAPPQHPPAQQPPRPAPPPSVPDTGD